MLKPLLIAFGLLFATQASATLVKEQVRACGVNKVCLDTSYLACKVKPKQAVKKKAVKKKVQAKAEKPCEQVVSNHYTIIIDEVKDNVPYSLIHDTPVTNIWTQPAQYRFNSGGFNGFGGFGMGGGYYIAKTAQEGTVTPVIVTPPTPVNNLNTPLPSAFWLFISALGLIGRRIKF